MLVGPGTTGASLEVVRGLPLAFIIVSDAESVDPIHTLHDLRGLHLGSWEGSLDFDVLPLLCWRTVESTCITSP